MKKQIEIYLAYPFLYRWKQLDDISVITNSDADVYFQLLNKVSSQQSAFDILKNIDGNFAAVVNTIEYCLASVDRVRSFPLFYKIDNQKILITDAILQKENEFIFDEKAISTFKKIFCTEGSDTLLQNWKQVQPGEFIFINKLTGDFSINRYFVFRNKLPTIRIDAVELRMLILNVFQSILDKIGNRPIIVPLSAGYDSRLIVIAIKELKAKNIFTYTYGRQDSFEKPIAEKIAQKLKLDWRFVEYNEELLDSIFSEEFMDYSSKNHFYTSLPTEQDFFALYYLQKNNLLPKNGVILSGYLGGSFAGNRSRYDFVSSDADDQQEYNFSNRGSKFIVNSIRVYEYFGLEWYMPFVATPLIDYSLHISIKERSIENGYHNFLSEFFFKPLNIDFKKPDHYYQTNYFKNLFKKYLPYKVVKFIQHKNLSNSINDPNNTNYLRKRLAETFSDIEKKEHATYNFNEVYVEYFLRLLQDGMKVITNK